MKEVLRALVIDNWQNEACNPNQQFFERWWGVIKGLAKAVLDWSGAHANEWFLILLYVIYIQNRTAVSSLFSVIPRSPTNSVRSRSLHLLIWRILLLCCCPLIPPRTCGSCDKTLFPAHSVPKCSSHSFVFTSNL